MKITRYLPDDLFKGGWEGYRCPLPADDRGRQCPSPKKISHICWVDPGLSWSLDTESEEATTAAPWCMRHGQGSSANRLWYLVSLVRVVEGVTFGGSETCKGHQSCCPGLLQGVPVTEKMREKREKERERGRWRERG